VTPDNYLKMCLIYLRVKSRLPVIIMGEVGCGKTSLVKFLCKDVLNERIEILNIYTGITKNNII
jgi:Ni2+-binding GTPase involved in maturation of urease and hydrogenase